MNFERMSRRQQRTAHLRRRLRRFASLMASWLADSGINPYQTAEQFSLDDTALVCDTIADLGARASLTGRQISDVQVGWALDLNNIGPELALNRLTKKPIAYLQPRIHPNNG